MADGDNDDRNDRERLAAAFDKLRARGYFADVQSWSYCCSRHAEPLLAGRDKFVFWALAADDESFCGTPVLMPDPDFVRQAMVASGARELLSAPEPDVETANVRLNEWMAENHDVLEACVLAKRVSEYGDLVRPLPLVWDGDASEICEALREEGLSVVEPSSHDDAIEVLVSARNVPAHDDCPWWHQLLQGAIMAVHDRDADKAISLIEEAMGCGVPTVDA